LKLPTLGKKSPGYCLARYTKVMLQLSKALINRPVLSLQTGLPIATTIAPLLNPNNLKIEGLYCQDRFEKKQLILLYQDIRDVLTQGIVVNNHEALSNPSELIRLKDTIGLHFELIGKPVVTVSKDKVGKVNDYATEIETMYIQKIYIGQNILRNLTGGSLSIDRTQIYEITAKQVIINDLIQANPIRAAAVV
jgi:sporulation protein YlmC with PRC-barrel domain